MTERERLIDTLGEFPVWHSTLKERWMPEAVEKLAEHLLANGVIVPPCKVGDIYYTIDRYCNTDPWETEKELVRAWDCEQYCGRSDCSFSELRINEHRFGSVVFILENQKYFGQYYFLTKEEAERALKERSEGK